MDQSSQMMRHPLRAFLLTPVLAALIHFIFYAIWDTARPYDLLEHSTLVAIIFVNWIPVAVAVIGIVMVVFALPIYVLLRARKWEGALITIVLAVAVAVLSSWPIALLFPPLAPVLSTKVTECQAVFLSLSMSCSWEAALSDLVPFLFSGLFGGAVFWKLYSGRWV